MYPCAGYLGHLFRTIGTCAILSISPLAWPSQRNARAQQSTTGKPLFQADAGGYLGKQAARWRLLLVRGRKTGERIPSRARVVLWYHMMSSLVTYPWSRRLPWVLLVFDHHGVPHPTRQQRSPCLPAEMQKQNGLAAPQSAAQALDGVGLD